MANVYILKSEKDKKLYIGSTINLAKRLSEHNKGKVPATNNRRPLHEIYIENYVKVEDARKREKYLKSAAGRRFLKTLNLVTNK